MSVTSVNAIDAKDFLFGELDKKRNIYFCPIYYKTPENHLITKTPAMVTSSGLKRKKNRWYIDCELRETDLKRHRELYKKLTMVDDMCIDVTADRSKDWFENQIPKRAIQARYQSPMIPGWADEPAKMRIEVLIEDSNDVVDKFHRDLDPKLVVEGSKVVLLMQLCGFWVSNNFLGCHWRVIKVIANVENPDADRRETEEPEHETHETREKREKRSHKEHKDREEHEEHEDREDRTRKDREERTRKDRKDDREEDRIRKSRKDSPSQTSQHGSSRENDRAISQLIKDSKGTDKPSRSTKSQKTRKSKREPTPESSEESEHDERSEHDEPSEEDERDRSYESSSDGYYSGSDSEKENRKPSNKDKRESRYSDFSD